MNPMDYLKKQWGNPERAEAYFRVIKWILEKINVKGKTVLDVGCGKGYTTAAYAAAGAKMSVGIDVSADIKKHPSVVGNQKKLETKTQFVQGTSDQLPFDENNFSGIIMNEALSHYAYPNKSLTEAHRVLKEGGYLYIFDDNNLLDLRGIFRRRFKRWPPYKKSYDEKRKNFLKKKFPDLNNSSLKKKVTKYRRWTLSEIKEALKGSRSSPELPPGKGPRDPETGAFAEREINPLTLTKRLKKIGFEPQLVPSRLAVISPVNKLVSFLSQIFHPISLLWTPGFTIIARK